MITLHERAGEKNNQKTKKSASRFSFASGSKLTPSIRQDFKNH